MLKLLGALIIVVCSTFAGQTASSRLTERKRTLQSFITLLENAKTKIQYSSLPLCEIFADSFVEYTFLQDKPFYPQWNEMLNKYRLVLTNEDIRLLSDFCKLLGATDTVGQIKNIDLYVRLLSDNISQAQENIEKKSKLYRVFGFSVGTALALILI